MKVNSNLDGLVIRRTFEEDLENVRTLWSRGDVMAFVGFPTGLQRSISDMERWLARKLANAPLEQHFSIYDAGSSAVRRITASSRSTTMPPAWT